MQAPIQNLANKSQILEMLSDGRLDQAKTQAQAMLAQNEGDRDAQYAFGIALLMNNEPAQAIDWLQKAMVQMPKDPVCTANLGIACLRADRREEAIKYLQAALVLKPDYDQARYNLGSAYIKNGQAELAIEQFRSLSKKNPRNMDYLCAHADALRENGQWRKAMNLYKRVLKRDPNFVRALTNVAGLLMNSGKMEDAVGKCRQAIALDPGNFMVHKSLGDCLVQLEELEDAMEAYADAYELKSDSVELCVAIGKVWLETADMAEAATWFQRALHIDQENTAAHCGLVNIMRESGNIEQALEMIKPVQEKAPDDPELLMAAADAQWEDGDAEGALAQLRRLQQLQPQRAALRGKIGQILSSAGFVEQAIEEYQAALEQNPRCVPALNGLATSQRGELEPAHLAVMEKMLGNKKLRSGTLASLYSGLAYHYDGTKDYEKAAAFSRMANSNQWDSRSKRGWEYDPAEYERHVSKLMEVFNADYFQRISLQAGGSNDETPVFIVAMPRSGTTLTEQILGRHSQVLGIGERNFASQSFQAVIRLANGEDGGSKLDQVSKLDSEAISMIAQRYLARLNELQAKSSVKNVQRVVDKMPDNYSLVGWILTLFPRARIIHCRRDPRDVALSCWLTQFGSIRWACQMEHLTSRIQQYQRVMDHWRRTIPDRFIELDYEALVANQEQESRRLVDYIGLEWEPECLEFYNSDRLVRTASITQVRQPIYSKSVAKWKSYEPYLNDLFSIISPEAGGERSES